jgi:hypothetical protein
VMPRWTSTRRWPSGVRKATTRSITASGADSSGRWTCGPRAPWVPPRGSAATCRPWPG